MGATTIWERWDSADRAAWETVLFWLLARGPEIAARIGNGPGEEGGMTLRQVVASSPRVDALVGTLSAALVSLRM